MLTRAQKESQVAELRDRFSRATSVFLADYRGLDVQSVNLLRSKLRAVGDGSFEYRVVKNRLLMRATEGLEAASLCEQLGGPRALAFSFGDPVALAKLLVDYAKEHQVFELKAGVVSGRAVGPSEIATLATLPSLEGLRGQLVGLLQAPAAKIARVLAAPAGQLARLVDARREQLEAGGDGAS